MYGTVHVHMVYSGRPEERSVEPLALPVRARFVRLREARTARLTGGCRASRAGRFSAVLLQLGGGLVLFVPVAGAGCWIGPRHPIGVATEAVTECVSPAAGWKTGTVPWRATLRARVWTLDERRRHVAGVFLVPALSGLDLAEPVMYLSWTSDVLVVDPP
jgi:hypothetical protein